ncbi:uncharacterized protein LOC135374476 [Ornithodoros turicata]|uniref:uncharacterized protein LOC135374476 n=1 Tax=Ornithodoros turicata TaxID=34597 RepID=UPI003139A97F
MDFPDRTGKAKCTTLAAPAATLTPRKESGEENAPQGPSQHLHYDPDHLQESSSDMDSLIIDEDADDTVDGFRVPRQQLKRKRRAERRHSSSSDDTVKSVPSSTCSTRAPSLTVLFRPISQGETVNSLQLTKLEQYLESEAPNEIAEIRLNYKKNIVAVDVKTAGGVNKLLGLSRLCAKSVSAFVPASARATNGVIRVSDTSLSDAEISKRLRAVIPVTSVRRLGKEGVLVKLSFSSGPLPKQVHIGTVKFLVSEYKPKPTQCFKCARFGHVNATCTRAQTCMRCAGNHDISACIEENTLKCQNCGKAHSTLDNACPVKQLETAAHRYSVNSRVPIREARRIFRASKERRKDPALHHETTTTTKARLRKGALHTKASFSEVIKRSHVPSPAPHTAEKTHNVAREPRTAAPILFTRNHISPKTADNTPESNQPQKATSNEQLPRFAAFIDIAFLVLRTLHECSWLPLGMRHFISLVLPLQQSLTNFVGV